MYLNDTALIAVRVNDLLSRLTLQEKVSLVHANGIFWVAGVPRLGIPELIMDDRPLGVRADVGDNFVPLGHTNDFATAMPATLGLAATWDTNLAREFGAVIGQEAVQRGKDVMFGPAVNIMRTPLDGRNEEFMGEDPFLASRIAQPHLSPSAHRSRHNNSTAHPGILECAMDAFFIASVNNDLHYHEKQTIGKSPEKQDLKAGQME